MNCGNRDCWAVMYTHSAFLSLLFCVCHHKLQPLDSPCYKCKRYAASVRLNKWQTQYSHRKCWFSGVQNQLNIPIKF